MIVSKLFQSSLAFAIIFAITQASYGVVIAHYRLDELNGTSSNSTVVDETGNNNGAILCDAPSTTGPTQGVSSVNAGKYNTAYYFDAALTHQVDVNPLSGDLLTRTGAFTYAAWIKPDAADNQTHATPTIIGTNGRGYILQIVQSGSDWDLVLAPGAGTSSALTSPGDTKIKTGEWTHVAITKDVNGSGGSGLSAVNFYINGVNVGSGNIGLTTITSSIVNRVFIGVSSAGQFYSGAIDDVWIDSEVLGPAAIAELAQVPEPGSLVMMSLGSLLALRIVRFRRTKTSQCKKLATLCHP